MNRFQRNYYKNCPSPPTKVNNNYKSVFLNDVFAPSKQAGNIASGPTKVMYHRSCFISPELKDFAQSMELPLIDYKNSLNDEHSNIETKEEFTSNTNYEQPRNVLREDLIPITIARLRELRKLLGCDVQKVENYSQITKENSREPSILEKFSKSESSSESDNISTEDSSHVEETPQVEAEKSISYSPSEVYISDVPTVHIIAEKFTKYKKDNIELRRLEEKIVCVEYNIYDSLEKNTVPFQKMRAFFSVKPEIPSGEAKGKINIIPSEVKNEFNISNSDLEKLNKKEIEIIDAKISEHNTYLDDLRKILKRNRILDSKKNKRFDLRTMYEIAKRNNTLINEEDITASKFFTKSDLAAFKDLVLKETDSNASGIVRRTIPRNNGIVTIMEDAENANQSQSFVKELFASM